MPGELTLKDEEDGRKYVVSGDGLKKPVKCKVLMLDGTESLFEVEESSIGNVLFLKACEHLNLLETDYFALSFTQADTKVWLKKEEPIKKQLRKAPWNFSFEVKFYPRELCHLKEELTRYQVYLQVRVDVLEGKLVCSFVTQAILASYAFQSQLGDWDPTEMGDDYATNIRFCPAQTLELAAEVIELHKNHRGMPAETAEYKYLENSMVISMYGCHMVDAKDRNGSTLRLGVSGVGFVCHKERIVLRRHHWTRVVKISFKRNKFKVLLRSFEGSNEPVTEEYALADRKAAKRFWRLAVEHHAFFRLKEPVKTGRGLFTGRNFLCGPTQFQAEQAAEGIARQNINFAREYHTMGRGVLDKGEAGAYDYQSATVDRAEETIAVSSTTRTLDRIKKNKPSVNYLAEEADNLSKGTPETPGDVFYQGQLGGNYGDQQPHTMRVSMMNVDEGDRTGQAYLKTPYPTENQRRLVSEDMEIVTSVHNHNTNQTQYDSADGRSNDDRYLNQNGVQHMDEQDYDQMLKDAILGVTDIDENLSVEKIEITKNE